MKKLFQKVMTLVSSVAMFAAALTLSRTCRLWLYQPSVPDKIREINI